MMSRDRARVWPGPVWTDIAVGVDAPYEMTAVTIDPDGAVIVSGLSTDSPQATGFDIVVRKYAP